MQTRLESLIESVVNILSGWLLSLCLWIFVINPVWNLGTKFTESLTITTIFTIVSIIRSYCWRRWFNARVLKKLRRTHETRNHA